MLRQLDLRRSLAQQSASLIAANLRHPQICGKQPFQLLERIQALASRRVVVVKINAGLRNPELLKALRPEILFQFLPPHWKLGRGVSPTAYIEHRFVVVEIPYPEDSGLNDFDVTVNELGPVPPASFGVGPQTNGEVITLHLEHVAHALFAGETGSGKSYAQRAAIWQLAHGGRAKCVLIDGKRGQGLAPCDGLPNQLGPLAFTEDDARAALAYVLVEMNRRYDELRERRINWPVEGGPDHWVVFVDEFQELIRDDGVARLLTILSQQGRAARIHLFLGTQKPTNDAFKGQSVIRDQLTTTIGLQVRSFAASSAATGRTSPRLDALLGAGDAYVIAPAATGEIVERVQVAYVPENQLRMAAVHRPQLEAWPAPDIELLDNGNVVGRPPLPFTDIQLGAAIYAASQDYGRPNLQRLLEGLADPVAGNQRASELVKTGRRLWEAYVVARSFEEGA